MPDTDSYTSTTVKPEVVFTEALLDEILAGHLRVPKFQRPFVWDPENMRQLFDSIYKGYPIGSLLTWETNEQFETLHRVGPFELPEPAGKPLNYLLDGHQRLTTLLAGLRLSPDAHYSKEPSDWKWWLFFDLLNKEFIHLQGTDREARYFPLRAVLRTVDFLNACRKLQSEFAGPLADMYIREAERLAQRIKDYKVPVTRIKGGTLDDAVSIFSRLNSLGEAMTADQMVSALTYREGPGATNLAESITTILEDLEGLSFGQLPRKQVLQVVLTAARLDLETTGWESIAKSLQKHGVGAASYAARTGLLGAARFLFEEVGVPGSGFLPYKNQLVVLSAFFLECQEPTSDQADTLKRWFWSTSLGGWFAGANPSQMRKGIGEMRGFATNPALTFSEMPLAATARPLPTDFNSKVARIRSLLIFLFARGPLDPVTAERVSPMEVQGVSRGLAPVFTDADQGVLRHPANRVFLRKGLGLSVKERILKVPEHNKELFLKSHCISPDAYQALRENDAKAFVDTRSRFIEEQEAEFYSQFGVTPPASLETDEADEDTD